MRHLISTKGWSRDAAISLLDDAITMTARGQTPTERPLADVTVANLFYENSTRTRVSFELAASRLGARVVTVLASGSSIEKGESLLDTAATLEAAGCDVVVLRHPESGAAWQLTQVARTGVRVINAGDGTNEHPTQALADAFTLREAIFGSAARGNGLDGVRVSIVGDIRHSRVARSNVHLLTCLGASVRLIAPPHLTPNNPNDWPATWHTDFDEALGYPTDAIMMLRVQRERMAAAELPDTEAYARAFGLTERRAAVQPEAWIMHPGPVNRGVEITDAVLDGSRSLISTQVTSGVRVRMAALTSLFDVPGRQARRAGER